MADLHTYEEGLMEKVRALVAPPQSSTATKPRNKKAKPPVAAVVARHGSFENNPYCNACGDGGNLLCCDRCPSSFHFFCCDPPVDPRHLPSGDWLCRHCMALEVDEDVPTLFRPLVEQALASNPLIFHIPSDMEKSEVMPGGSRRLLPHKTAQEREEEAQRACYACSRDFHSGPLVSCDFCPLVFHLDCLDPPLTTPPTSVWMCPMHAHTKTPGFDHPRLTERLQALAESQEDVDHHTVKMDFINKINRIPHHKKLTKHHNRRVTEVPAAVKALYAHPLPDVAAVPSLSNCLLTSEEGVERRRREEQRERREFAAPRQPTFTRDQDEWTRQTILCQLEQNSSTRAPSHLQTHRHHHYNTQSPASPKPLHRSASPASTTSSPHENDSLSPSASYPDFSVFLAAHKLLELSGRGSLPNGIIRIPRDRTTGNRDNHNSGLQKEELDVQSPRNERSPLGEEDFVEKHAEEANHCGNLSDGQNLIPTETSMEVEKGGSESRGGLGGKEEAVEPKPAEPQVETEPKVGNSKDSTDEREDSSESRAVEEAPPRGSGHQSCDDSPPSVELESGDSDGDDGDSGADAAENPNLFRPGFVPDLNLLDERLVRLLAVQRVQQLFAAGSGRGSDESMSAKSEGMCMDIPEPLNAGKHLNGLRPVLLPKLAKVVFSADALRVAPAILCPVSGIGLAHPFQKVVTSVGTGSDMDVCLLQYGHCNYLSPRHASVFFDKATEEYELINYSDHGSVVDGVLYSCDFSDKGRDDGNKLEPPVFTLDDLTARGVGLRAERARARIEEARKSLEEKEQARRALEGALKLARPSLSTEDSANGGPRNHADSRPVLLGSKRLSDSSVVSIPLSKTKRHCTEESPKRASPQKPSLTKEKGLRSTNHDRDGKAAILKCHEELDCRRGSPSPSKNKTTPSPACSKNKSTPSPGQNKTTPSSTCSKNKNTPSPGKSKNTPSPGKSKNTPSPGKNTSTAEIKSSPQEPSQRTNSVLSPRGELATFSQPCMCKRSASSLVGGNGRGWEGTATLYHGSRLRFGCVQFVLSIAGRPGHGELVKALVELNHRMNTNET